MPVPPPPHKKNSNVGVTTSIIEIGNQMFPLTVAGDAAVFASRTSSMSSASNPVPMTSIITNYRNLWNTSTHIFTLSALDGLFWVGLIVGAESRTQVDYRLQHTGSPVAGITRTSTAHSSPDTLSRELPTYLSAGNTLHVSSGYRLHSDGDRQTGITIFCLSDSMMRDNLVVFHVARDETFAGYANPVPFNVELYNEGLGYDTASHRFIAPSDGIYYFSFSVGLISGETADFILYKNTDPVVNLYRAATTHNGFDTMSRSILLPLEEDDEIYLVNSNGKVAWSSQLYETSFSGFKYEPKNGLPV